MQARREGEGDPAAAALRRDLAEVAAILGRRFDGGHVELHAPSDDVFCALCAIADRVERRLEPGAASLHLCAQIELGLVTVRIVGASRWLIPANTDALDILLSRLSEREIRMLAEGGSVAAAQALVWMDEQRFPPEGRR